MLLPHSEDIEDRIIYYDGAYFASPDDNAADNLILLLDLNNTAKIKHRKDYIKKRKESIIDKGLEGKEKKYFQEKFHKETDSIKYLRANKERFRFNIRDMISAN